MLELGGSDPFIVLPSADLMRAVATAVKARVVNNGQSCIAAKRFIVVDAVYDEFVRDFAAAMGALRVGDPTAPGTELGPLAHASIRDGVAKQVERSVAAGARLLTGGRRPEGPGCSTRRPCSATCRPMRPAAREELFGPVAAAVPRRAASTTPSRSRTRPRSGWARRRGRATARRPSGSRASSKRALCSSTAWSRPTRASRSAA